MLHTRRELISAFLGVSVANVACRKSSAPASGPIPGRLVDVVHTTGHLLRGPPLARAAQTTRSVDVLVVGAGAAGLSAAWRLRGAGLQSLEVCEVDSESGGTARSGQNEVSRFPWGAHYLPTPLTSAGPVPRLLREMGVIDGADDTGRPRFAESALIHEPDERLFYRGAWYEGLYLRAGASPDDLAQLERFETLIHGLADARDSKGRKAFAVPLESGSDDAEWTALDKISMSQWMDDNRFTSSRLRWVVDYACRDDYGALSADISAWAALWYFCARRTGDQRSEGYLSWPEGNGRLISQLQKSLEPSQVSLNLLVHSLEPSSTGWNAHGWRNGKPEWISAKQVVLAVPRFVAARLISAWRAEPPAFLKAFRTSPWAVANLTLSKRPAQKGGFPLAWDNVFYESKSLGYVVATHQRLRADEHGPTVVTWYYPLTGSDEVAERTRLYGTGYSDWEAVVRADLLPAHRDLGQLATSLEVMRWGHAMIRPYPGFLWGSARKEALESLLGSLHFAHSDLGGLALFEEANHFGVLAAEKVLTGLGQRVESWLG